MGRQIGIEGVPESGAHQPHDKLFRAAFEDTPTAVAAFRAFLPQRMTRHLDMSVAERQPGSYIDEDFKSSESDVLYRIGLRGKDAFLYILFEHQTTEDPWMALRLLGYQVRIWNRFRKAQPGERQLPVIIPLVLVQSDRGWSASPRFASLFQLNEEESQDYNGCIPDFTFQLLELAKIPFERLIGTPLGTATLRVMKAERIGAVLSDLVWEAIEKLDAGNFTLVLRYLLCLDLDRGKLKIRLASLSSETLRNQAMSVAEQLKQEGRQEGQQEGRREGVAIGEIRGRRKGQEEGATKGLLAGTIQTLQRVLGQRATPANTLLRRSPEQLRAQSAALQRRLR